MTLRANALCCRRNGQRLFDPVSFQLAPGAALQLRGPNGAGKTTLLRALAGLGAPPEGTARLGEAALPGPEASVAMSGHLDAVKPALSVSENLTFWARIAGQATAETVIDTFDLGALRDRPAGRLSAGQRRRLGLARLPLTGARLWLMDEPTTALDAENTARLGRVLAAHLAGGGMAVIATHLPLPVEMDSLTLSPAAPEGRGTDPFLDGAFA